MISFVTKETLAPPIMNIIISKRSLTQALTPEEVMSPILPFTFSTLWSVMMATSVFTISIMVYSCSMMITYLAKIALYVVSIQSLTYCIIYD